MACKEWNDLPAEDTFNFGSYQSHQDLSAATWDLMRFKEVELDDGDIAWLMRKDSCMHCDDPGLPGGLPGARGPSSSTRTASSTSTRRSASAASTAWRAARSTSPASTPRRKKVYKCTLCVDRVSASLEPACVKSCPTGAIKFGGKHEMLDYAPPRSRS